VTCSQENVNFSVHILEFPHTNLKEVRRFPRHTANGSARGNFNIRPKNKKTK